MMILSKLILFKYVSTIFRNIIILNLFKLDFVFLNSFLILLNCQLIIADLSFILFIL